ncbi:MAG: DNA topoisomerase I [Candidatus Methanomethylicaceae archaeon]
MSYQLIICEKPSAALKMAYALGGSTVRRERKRGVPIFWLEIEGNRAVVVPALGHLYEVEQGSVGWSFPIFDVRWAPINERRKKSWIQTIKEVARRADSFVNACDFDVEGSLIGYMILKNACTCVDCTRDGKTKRMKFSTLTAAELRSAYQNAMKGLDLERVYAGKVRHEIDWIFGVNTSRALMDALGSSGDSFGVLSAGRVQSPTLYALYKREVEINLHVPDPFWCLNSEVAIKGERYTAEYKIREFLLRSDAEEIAKRCEGKKGYIKEVLVRRRRIPPPPPFNLGDLQREAYRVFGYAPSRTQKIAERLYLGAAISYPRTSSQRLPRTLGLEGIVRRLGRSERYREVAKRVLMRGELKPREGRLSDPAHPAIHPTGVLPTKMSREEGNVYDLIVRRFFATFGKDAIMDEREATVEVNESDLFKIRVRGLVDSGWTDYYKPYTFWRVQEIPEFKIKDEALLTKVEVVDRFTLPPERYTPSKLIAYMEKRGLGTKSTRAEIIDNMYKRGYIEGEEIRVTELGFAIIGILKRFFPELISVDMTSKLEDEMTEIEEGRRNWEGVIIRAIDGIKPVFERIIMKYEEIGEELARVMEWLKRYSLGSCPQCKSGFMRVVRSRKTGKRFIGCSNYPGGCDFSCPIPQRGRISRSRYDCKVCGSPVIEVGEGRRNWRFCINEECPSKRR